MKNFSKLALMALFIASGVCLHHVVMMIQQTKISISKLGGTTMVADPNNPGQMIEQGAFKAIVLLWIQPLL